MITVKSNVIFLKYGRLYREPMFPKNDYCIEK